MFNKLRNRFLIVNLVTISVIMLVAFASIYTITYRNVQNDIQMELHKVTDSYQRSPGNSDRPRAMGDNPPVPPMDKGPMNNGDIPPERSVSFMLQTDQKWNHTATTSHLDMDNAFYELALEEAVSINKVKGKFSLDGSHWIFTNQPIKDGFMFVFLDITAQQNILTNLIYTFAVVGLVMLIILYFVSRFFANRSIKPVEEAFDKQKKVYC